MIMLHDFVGVLHNDPMIHVGSKLSVQCVATTVCAVCEYTEYWNVTSFQLLSKEGDTEIVCLPSPERNPGNLVRRHFTAHTSVPCVQYTASMQQSAHCVWIKM